LHNTTITHAGIVYQALQCDECGVKVFPQSGMAAHEAADIERHKAMAHDLVLLQAMFSKMTFGHRKSPKRGPRGKYRTTGFRSGIIR
jgi:hypothetical protein